MEKVGYKKRDSRLYQVDILDSGSAVLKFVKGLSFECFCNDRKTSSAVAENQMNNIKGWQSAGSIEYAGWWEYETLLQKIERSLDLLQEGTLRDKMSKAGRFFC